MNRATGFTILLLTFACAFVWGAVFTIAPWLFVVALIAVFVGAALLAFLR